MHLFHLYKKHIRIKKPHYSNESRKSFDEWDEQFTLKVGYSIKDKLFLPRNIESNLILKSIDALVIQDVIGYSSFNDHSKTRQDAKQSNLPIWYLNNQEKPEEYFSFQKPTHNWKFELFSIDKSSEGTFQLHLEYNTNSFKIGAPKRNDFKLCDLELNRPVKIKINGKSDSTMSRGAERTYTEYEYIVEYLGEINHIEMVAESKIAIEKRIPVSIEKIIDVRKILY